MVIPLLRGSGACRLDGGRGGWSSSLLRSITSAAGLLDDSRPDEVDASRDDAGGVLINDDLLSSRVSFLTAAILGISLISTRSPSLSLVGPSPDLGEISSSEVFRQAPCVQ